LRVWYVQSFAKTARTAGAAETLAAPTVTATGNQNAFGVHTTPDVFLKARFADIQENIVRGALNFKF
jgi:hypothetical protein